MRDQFSYGECLCFLVEWLVHFGTPIDLLGFLGKVRFYFKISYSLSAIDSCQLLNQKQPNVMLPHIKVN